MVVLAPGGPPGDVLPAGITLLWGPLLGIAGMANRGTSNAYLNGGSNIYPANYKTRGNLVEHR